MKKKERKGSYHDGYYYEFDIGDLVEPDKSANYWGPCIFLSVQTNGLYKIYNIKYSKLIHSFHPSRISYYED